MITIAAENRLFEGTDIDACFVEAALLMKAALPPGIRLEARAEPAMPAATLDPESLLCAILGLLFNARDAMPGGGVIFMTAFLTREEVAEIVLRVADSGLGMSEETLRHATTPFFTTKTTGLGGLGLSLIVSLLEEAGGRLDIESAPGAGTTVTLRLPAQSGRARDRRGAPKTINLEAVRT
jgi:signal transduction histidine kinase